jgi:hypothetical protein
MQRFKGKRFGKKESYTKKQQKTVVYTTELYLTSQRFECFTEKKPIIKKNTSDDMRIIVYYTPLTLESSALLIIIDPFIFFAELNLARTCLYET